MAITLTANTSDYAGHAADIQTAAVDAIAAETDVTADITAVNAATTLALANGTISGDPTALGLVQAIADAMTTLGTDYTTLTDALAPAADAGAATVVLSYDPDTVLTINTLRQYLAAIMLTVAGAGDLT